MPITQPITCNVTGSITISISGSVQFVPIAPPAEGTTWDPENKHASVTLSDASLTASTVSETTVRFASTNLRSTGKRALKITATFADGWGSDTCFGLATSAFDTQEEGNYVGGTDDSWGMFFGGSTRHNQTTTSLGLSASSGEPMYGAVDFDAGKIWFGNDGGFNGDIEAGTDPAWTFAPNTPLLIVGSLATEGLIPSTMTLDTTYSSGSFAAWDA